MRGENRRKGRSGVLGSERGVGVTQFCVALANFISLESGSNVQLLDVSGTGQLACVPVTADKRLFWRDVFRGRGQKADTGAYEQGL